MQYKIVTFNFGNIKGYGTAEDNIVDLKNILSDEPDIVCCQELINTKDLEIEGYNIYSGLELAIIYKKKRFYKAEPLNVKYYFGSHNDQDRMIYLNLYEEEKPLFCINVHGLVDQYENKRLLKFCDFILDKYDNVLMAGDFNGRMNSKYIISDIQYKTTKAGNVIDYILFKPNKDIFISDIYAYNEISKKKRHDHLIVCSDFKVEK